MKAIKLEQRMPIPMRKAGDRSKYPWVIMKIGESFFVADKPIEGMSARAVHAAKRFGRKYTCRSENGGVRIWRIK
jgi:hypothetical protein